MRIDPTALEVGHDGAVRLADHVAVAYADAAWLGRPGTAPALVLDEPDDGRVLAALGGLVADVVARTGRGPVAVVGDGAVAVALRVATAASPEGPAPTTIDTTGDEGAVADLLAALPAGGTLVAAAPPRSDAVAIDVYDLLHVTSRTLVAMRPPGDPADGATSAPLRTPVTVVADGAVPPPDALLVRMAASDA